MQRERKKITKVPPPSLIAQERERGSEVKRWESEAGRLNVERRKHNIIPQSPPLTSESSVDNPSSISR